MQVGFSGVGVACLRESHAMRTINEIADVAINSPAVMKVEGLSVAVVLIVSLICALTCSVAGACSDGLPVLFLCVCSVSW